MILLAVHINNPADVPGKVELVFSSQTACEQSLQTMTYQLKFRQFKIEGQCKKNDAQ
jgi:hypothetical protein